MATPMFEMVVGACVDSVMPGRLAPRAELIAVYAAVMSKATMTTTEGDIVLELFDEDAPKTVANFKQLSGQGFYDGLIFHRIIKDFMIQGGCPLGTGTGDPGYKFEDEINDHKVVRGALAMANAGPNTNGSQFFIVTTDAAPWLDGKHTVFGEVVEGMDVIDRLEALPTDAHDRPQEAAGSPAVTVEEAQPTHCRGGGRRSGQWPSSSSRSRPPPPTSRSRTRRPARSSRTCRTAPRTRSR